MDHRDKVIYVTGKFRGPTSWAIECNIREAEETALEVWKLGATALCPHLNTRFFQGELPDREWLIGDLKMMERCDAVMTVPGWRYSEGTQAEVKHALSRGIPVFHKWPDFEKWLAGTWPAGKIAKPEEEDQEPKCALQQLELPGMTPMTNPPTADSSAPLSSSDSGSTCTKTDDSPMEVYEALTIGS